MLIYSMGVSVDGFIADRCGEFGWTVPSEEHSSWPDFGETPARGLVC